MTNLHPGTGSQAASESSESRSEAKLPMRLDIREQFFTRFKDQAEFTPLGDGLSLIKAKSGGADGILNLEVTDKETVSVQILNEVSKGFSEPKQFSFNVVLIPDLEDPTRSFLCYRAVVSGHSGWTYSPIGAVRNGALSLGEWPNFDYREAAPNEIILSSAQVRELFLNLANSGFASRRLLSAGNIEWVNNEGDTKVMFLDTDSVRIFEASKDSKLELTESQVSDRLDKVTLSRNDHYWELISELSFSDGSGVVVKCWSGRPYTTTVFKLNCVEPIAGKSPALSSLERDQLFAQSTWTIDDIEHVLRSYGRLPRSYNKTDEFPACIGTARIEDSRTSLSAYVDNQIAHISSLGLDWRAVSRLLIESISAYERHESSEANKFRNSLEGRQQNENIFVRSGNLVLFVSANHSRYPESFVPFDATKAPIPTPEFSLCMVNPITWVGEFESLICTKAGVALTAMGIFGEDSRVGLSGIDPARLALMLGIS